jgi:hypothetical protein
MATNLPVSWNGYALALMMVFPCFSIIGEGTLVPWGCVDIQQWELWRFHSNQLYRLWLVKFPNYFTLLINYAQGINIYVLLRI